MRIKKARPLSRRGFTLLEIIVALFVFSIAMVAVTAIFASFISANRTTKNTQKALEDAEQAMNIMTKEIRTSSVAFTSGSPVTTLGILEYSDPAGPQCIGYRFNGTNIQYTAPVAVASGLPTDCTQAVLTAAGATYANLINTPITGGSFIVTPSAPQTVGKVTILMSVTAGTIQTPIQGTVSLRDYSVSD